MGQFLVGLFAGVVVSLVMEWVIDWTGLLPKRSTTKTKAQKAVPGSTTTSSPSAKRADVSAVSGASTSSTNAETSRE